MGKPSKKDLKEGLRHHVKQSARILSAKYYYVKATRRATDFEEEYVVYAFWEGYNRDKESRHCTVHRCDVKEMRAYFKCDRVFKDVTTVCVYRWKKGH